MRRHDDGALLFWVAAVLVARIALAWLGIMRHRTMTFMREDASARSAEVLLRHLSNVGAVLSRRMMAGYAHDADRVVVMDAGRVVELGSHDELLAAAGAYAELWRSWHG